MSRARARRLTRPVAWTVSRRVSTHACHLDALHHAQVDGFGFGAPAAAEVPAAEAPAAAAPAFDFGAPAPAADAAPAVSEQRAVPLLARGARARWREGQSIILANGTGVAARALSATCHMPFWHHAGWRLRPWRRCCPRAGGGGRRAVRGRVAALVRRGPLRQTAGSAGASSPSSRHDARCDAKAKVQGTTADGDVKEHAAWVPRSVMAAVAVAPSCVLIGARLVVVVHCRTRSRLSATRAGPPRTLRLRRCGSRPR